MLNNLGSHARVFQVTVVEVFSVLNLKCMDDESKVLSALVVLENITWELSRSM